MLRHFFFLPAKFSASETESGAGAPALPVTYQSPSRSTPFCPNWHKVATDYGHRYFTKFGVLWPPWQAWSWGWPRAPDWRRACTASHHLVAQCIPQEPFGTQLGMHWTCSFLWVYGPWFPQNISLLFLRINLRNSISCGASWDRKYKFSIKRNK